MLILKLKDYEITESQNNADKYYIRHESGEGGEFNKEKVIAAIYEAVDKFYKENF